MRNRDFFPTGNLNTRRHLKIKKKDVYFKYISVLREKYRYKVLRYLGCIFSEPDTISSDCGEPREDKGDGEGIPHTHPIP